MRAPELSTGAEKIDKIITRINTGDIKIPAFQRAYVWKQDQILDLMDSIIKNYPIGSILLWSTTEKLRHTRNIAGYSIPDNAEEYPVNYVLDGQQRISSIYATFSDKSVQDAATAKYNPNLNIFEIYYDFTNKKFIPKIDAVSDVDTIYLRDFLNAAKLIGALKVLDSKFHTDAQDLYSKFINYELPVVTIKNREKHEVGIIFERINNTGTKLTTLDLMTAWTWTDDFHLLESMSDLQDELEAKNFGELTQNILLQALSGLIQNDTTTIAVTKLSGEQVRDNWGNFCEALRKAIDFLSSEIKCAHIDFLPYQQQMIALTKFFGITNRPTASQLSELKKWFWKTSFSNRYSTGQTTEKMNTDIERIIEVRADNFSEIQHVRSTVTHAELIETKFSKANPLTRAFLLLLAQFGPIDLVKGVSVDISKSLSKYNRKEYHHVFPNAFLKALGVPTNRIFSMVNFCFLPSDSNKNISNKKPSEYFRDLIPAASYDTIAISNLIPLDKNIYDSDNYDKFLDERAKLILSELSKKIT